MKKNNEWNTNHTTSPNSNFILVTDSQGDIVEHFPENSVIDVIFQRIGALDSEFPGDAPHSAWMWYSETKSTWGKFTQVHEVIGKDPKQ